MREILFRGKSKNSKRWRVGNLVQTLIYGEYYCRITVDDGNISSYLVNNETVGQYTGIDDKNGVKVFEGDIIRTHDTYPGDNPNYTFTGVVKYCDSSFVVERGPVTYHRWMDYEIEVIGNIYDNPEMVKKITV